jgi:hypothetical protein
MSTENELSGMIIQPGDQVRAGQRAAAELAHFRESFALAPDVDLVTEFDWRAHRDTLTIQGLQVQLAHEREVCAALVSRNLALKEDILKIQHQMGSLAERALKADIQLSSASLDFRDRNQGATRV